MIETCEQIIVDWGTSNFRAFALAGGEVLDTIEAPMGLLQVSDGNFGAALEGVLANCIASYKSTPVLMAGMVGSMKGWVNVPYATAPVAAAELLEKAHSFELPWGAQATILPGVSFEPDAGVFDVMRGEEVQLFGLSAITGQSEFSAMLPGTHNKHVSFAGDKIEGFKSFLTGELYSVISDHMLIGKGLDSSQLGKHDAVFSEGVIDGVATDQLTSTLFRAWTHRLFKRFNESEVPDYLSGLLIGNELKNLSSSHYYLVGGSGLCKRYEIALSTLGVASDRVSGNDCFLAGMRALAESA